MNIAIHAPTSALPWLRKLANLLRQWGLGKHKYFVFCNASALTEMARVFESLPVVLEPNLPAIHRLPPLDSNEPFLHIAGKMVAEHWFYLPVNAVPISKDWADKLETEYIASGKPYLGSAAYLPKRYQDANGIVRVSMGEPFILEPAVYPAALTTKTKYNMLNRTIHHEVLCKSERFPNAHLTELIQDAKWDSNFRLSNVSHGTVLVAHVLDDAMLDELLGGTPPPVITEKIVVKEVEPEKPSPMEVKIPTIKVFKSSEEMRQQTTTENLDSPKAEEQVTVEPKRSRGRPRKVPASK